MTVASKIWQDALPFLEEEMTSASFNGFIAELQPFILQKNTLLLEVSTEFKRSHLRERYVKNIENSIFLATGRQYGVDFILPSEKKDIDMPADEQGSTLLNTLNKRYTFDTFVIGQSNHFAHAAANTVANNPGRSYNPLFIYGGVGLGKTHLMHAIGNQIFHDNNEARIMYVTSEKFTNELIVAIRTKRNEEFRDKYRNIDVLMVDDIQFISNKEGTQVEFFNTFNHLYEDQKQIVISSDKPPKEIPTLEDRLRSRFEWGLQVDIQPPDYETRVAILQKKSEVENFAVDPDVLSFIADKIKSNIRELEGTLTRVMAYGKLYGESVDMKVAQKALKDVIPSGSEIKITAEMIKEIVSEYYNIDQKDMDSKKRSQDIVFPRQVAMYLVRELTDLSLPKIGEKFSRDHTTVLYGCEKIAVELREDARLQMIIEDLIKRIQT